MISWQRFPGPRKSDEYYYCPACNSKCHYSALDNLGLCQSCRTPETDNKIETFLEEYARGEHRLTPEDEAALERARPALFLKLKLLSESKTP